MENKSSINKRGRPLECYPPKFNKIAEGLAKRMFCAVKPPEKVELRKRRNKAIVYRMLAEKA